MKPPISYSAARAEGPVGSAGARPVSATAEVTPIKRHAGDVLGFMIDATTWELALARIGNWADRRSSRCICLCNVHSLVTARGDAAFGQAVQGADLALPDGAPIAWALRGEGFTGQQRLSGPDLMLHTLAAAQAAGHVVSFFGSTQEVLDDLRSALGEKYPELQLGEMISPPFRGLTPEEDNHFVHRINDAGTQILFVGLGCPKQELWMARHRGLVHAPMIGVGAAFAFHAGSVKRAPLWMQRNGLEWLHRLATEPRRLAGRYLTTNSVFLGHMLVRSLKRLFSGKR
jgi:N-acetylglucosaminyldiphosphoundecaprenol N-acetyl-beta-D-mannosaminyltransferase